jgi:hypothetical protein
MDYHFGRELVSNAPPENAVAGRPRMLDSNFPKLVLTPTDTTYVSTAPDNVSDNHSGLTSDSESSLSMDVPPEYIEDERLGTPDSYLRDMIICYEGKDYFYPEFPSRSKDLATRYREVQRSIDLTLAAMIRNRHSSSADDDSENEDYGSSVMIGRGVISQVIVMQSMTQ